MAECGSDQGRDVALSLDTLGRSQSGSGLTDLQGRSALEHQSHDQALHRLILGAHQ